MQPLVKEQLPIFTGLEHAIFCPDGRTVRIRETNGNDDDILSKMSDAVSGESLINFLTDITLHDSYVNGKPTSGDILEWPVNVRSYVLFKQRILNHGPKMEFNKVCSGEKCKTKTKYEVDLVEDFDNPLDKPDEIKPGNDRIQLYPQGNKRVIEFVISSGKKFRFKIYDGILEKAALELPGEDTTQNTKLLLRELELFNADHWIRVTSFHGFSSREMGEVRANIDKYDAQFIPDVHTTCPKCKLQEVTPLFFIGDFYFPVPQI